ncbi:MAG: PKD domain-containing protein [Planctomycetaceae bacterium]
MKVLEHFRISFLKRLLRWRPASHRRGRSQSGTESLESRLLLAAINWDGGGDGTTWTDAANWAGDVLPGASDTAVIDLPGSDPTIVYNTTSTVAALQTKESINFTGGVLTVTTGATVESGAVATLAGGQLSGGAWDVAAGQLRATGNSNNRLSGVMVSGELLLDSNSSRVKIENGTTFTTARLTGNSSSLGFAPDSVITGNIIFDGVGGGSRFIEMNGTSGTVTIASGGVVETAPGFGGSVLIGPNFQFGSASMTLVNQGTIRSSVSGRTVTVQPAAFTNNGSLEVTDGTLTINSGDWQSSSGMIDVSGGTLRLDGNYRTASLNQSNITRTGGAVLIGGNFDNSGETLTLNNATGSWRIDGGTITGGTVNLLDGQTLSAASNSNNRLSGVTVSGELLLDLTSSRVKIENGTTFTTARLSSNSSSLGFAPDSVITGNIIFDGGGGGRFIEMNGTSGTVTIASGGVVETAPGFLGSVLIGPNSQFGSASMTLVNQGTIRSSVSGRTVTVQPAVFTNLSGTTLSGGTWIASDGGILRLPTGADVVTNDASITIDGASAAIFSGSSGAVNAVANLASVTAAGSLTISGGKTFATTAVNFSNSGDVTIGAASSFSSSAGAGSYTQSSGSTVVDGTLTVPGNGPMDIVSGLLAGSGIINADVTVGGSSAPIGVFTPGTSPGRLEISGDLTLTAFSTTVIEIGGPTVGSEYDQVSVSGNATLGGTLEIDVVDLDNGFTPQVGNVFAVVTGASSRTGEFSSMTGLQINNRGLFFDIEYHDHGLDLIVAELDAGADATVDEGLPFNLLATFGDPLANDDYTATIDWGDGSPVLTATVDQIANTVAGSYHYPDDGGVYTVTFTLLADGVVTAVDSREITVTNVDPTLEVVGTQTVQEGAVLSLSNLGTFTDPGFDNPSGTPATVETFTYSINWGDGTAADSGSATVDTPGAAGVLTAGSFDGSHTYADNGTYTVSVTVTDDDGGSDTQTFSVTVGNVDPTLSIVGNQSIDEGSPLNLTNIGTFTDPGFDNPSGTPATVETFTYSINWGDGTAADSGSATVDTPGAAGVLTAGSFDGSHTYADNGTYTVSVTVTDDDGGSDTQTFSVTVSASTTAEVTGFDANGGLQNRSAVKSVDLVFSDAAFLTQLLNSLSDGDSATDRVRVERRDLAGNVIGSGEFLELPASAFVQDGANLTINFGSTGLQQDGVYVVVTDMDGDLSNGFEDSRRFHRLLGDVNGDGKVDLTDLSKTRTAYRSPPLYSEADVDGDGDVDRIDLTIFSSLARTGFEVQLLFDRGELDD